MLLTPLDRFLRMLLPGRQIVKFDRFLSERVSNEIVFTGNFGWPETYFRTIPCDISEISVSPFWVAPERTRAAIRRMSARFLTFLIARDVYTGRLQRRAVRIFSDGRHFCSSNACLSNTVSLLSTDSWKSKNNKHLTSILIYLRTTENLFVRGMQNHTYKFSIIFELNCVEYLYCKKVQNDLITQQIYKKHKVTHTTNYSIFRYYFKRSCFF